MTNRPRLAPDAPADTRMMGIVHSALRRDLARTRLVLETQPGPDDHRRQAIADHVLWCMAFLHHHHEGEDAGLYPMVVRQNPAAAELVADMDADHTRIVPAMEALEGSARAYRAGASPESLLDAVGTLCEVLLPHLAREELEMMPVVSASISEAQWRAWTEGLKSTRLSELAFEGHWLMDGLGGDDLDHLLTMVPAVPRFLLVHLLGGRYRRTASAAWDGTPAAQVPALTVSAPEASGGGR